MEKVVGVLHRMFAIGVAIATVAALWELFSSAELSLLEDLDDIFGILAIGAFFEMVGFVLVEGYSALRRRT